MTLWGKINGSKADYYVVQAVQEGGEGDGEGADADYETGNSEAAEARGTGAN